MNFPLSACTLADPESAAVWQYFATLCSIPRASKNEGPLRAHLRDWAASLGLQSDADPAGNLIVRKPASDGYEHVPPVILQAHLDMVCQKSDGVAHDFTRDPLVCEWQDGWLRAPHTTLGADNGIGVALIQAVLASGTASHPPLEALFTVDEEAGMGGARALAGERLQGRRLLNLDTEEWGRFYVGCAGGLDVDITRHASAEPLPAGHVVRRIDLRGLRGGHSGVDIHEERGNAIKLLVRLLCALQNELPYRLASLHGGSARNALPRAASALITLPPAALAPLQAVLAEWQSVLQRELAGIDDGLQLSCSEADADAVLTADEQALWLHSLHAAPHGVWRTSRARPGVVDTSNNLGIVDLRPDSGHCNFMVRSLRDSCSQALADEIGSLFALSGSRCVQSGHYPGWTTAVGSPLLALCQRVYRERFGDEAAIQVIHAGLECGLLGARIPGLDIVSFGPTIRGAHAPGEAVEVASVGRCWQLLTALLAAMR